MQPSTFEDLIAMNALYRPGPMDYIPDFIARKHGLKPIEYDIPIMEKYLKDTYGITVYQEQVMLLSRLLANFTRGQSDTLRKAMGKKMIDKMNELKALFIEGGTSNGHDAKVLEKIWADWEKFASYAFNKSHATCYSWVAFQTAYLKANYPAEYMAAVLSRNLADITKLTGFMDECKSMKIKVKGPDVNESFAKFGVNAKGDIRFGLAGVKGVGANVVNDIIEARQKGGPFESIYDFVERVNLSSLNRRTLEALALSGAFDCFSEIKREDFFERNSKDEQMSEVLMRYGQLFQNDKQQSSNSLFGDDEPAMAAAARPQIKHAVPWFDSERLNKEKELVGMYLSGHPLDQYFLEVTYGCNGNVKALNEGSFAEGHEITIGGMVTSFESRPTKSGGQMGFMKFEDYTGSTEIRLFGKDYIQFHNYGIPGTPLLISGHFQRRFKTEEVKFVVTKMQLLEEVKGKLVHSISFKLQKDNINENLHNLLKQQIKESTENRCNMEFRIYDPDSKRTVKMVSDAKIPLDKTFLEVLTDMNIDYKVND